MNFNDIFKTNFLEKVTSFSFLDAVIALLGAFLIGLFIYLIYKKTYAGVMYSRAFNISLIALTMLTTFVILAVTSNVVLSLGMVGALSIVRFRTAIKDPMDLVFLFWSIGAGIILGAGLIPLAFLGSILIGLILIFFTQKNVADLPYIVVINCLNETAEMKAIELLKSEFPKNRLKSKTMTSDSKIELVVDIRMKNNNSKFINKLTSISGVSNASLVSYNGEYLS
jgi:uncharacterized membrane protein YhiD involved in acid resistance